MAIHHTADEGAADEPEHAPAPYWADSAAMPRFPRLERDHHVDVVVIGGGITGLTSACLLAAAGRQVLLLERRRLAAIDTGHTSAHLTMVTDARLTELARRFGRTHAQAVWDAGLAAIARTASPARRVSTRANTWPAWPTRSTPPMASSTNRARPPGSPPIRCR